MSLKSDLADLDIKDYKLQKYLENLTDAVELVRNNVIIGDRESKVLVPKPSDNEYCRILPQRLLVDEIKFSGDLNGLALQSSNSMCCLLQHSNAQSIADVTFAVLNFNTVLVDTDGMHVSSSNQRVTIQHSGIYLFQAAATFNPAGTGTVRLIGLRVDGTTCFARMSVSPQGGSTPSLFVSNIITLKRAQYVEVFVYQDSGAPLTMVNTYDANQHGPKFSVHRLS